MQYMQKHWKKEDGYLNLTPQNLSDQDWQSKCKQTNFDISKTGDKDHICLLTQI